MQGVELLATFDCVRYRRCRRRLHRRFRYLRLRVRLLLFFKSDRHFLGRFAYRGLRLRLLLLFKSDCHYLARFSQIVSTYQFSSAGIAAGGGCCGAKKLLTLAART